MKAKEVKALPEKVEAKPCIICGKKVTAFYGTWGVYGDAGTCSKSCEMEQDKRSHSIFFGDFDHEDDA